MIGIAKEGERIPWWAAVAWHCPMRRASIYAPIGIAQLIGLARWCYFALQCPISKHGWEELKGENDALLRTRKSLTVLLDDMKEAKRVAEDRRDNWERIAIASIYHLEKDHGCGAFKIIKAGSEDDPRTLH